LEIVSLYASLRPNKEKAMSVGIWQLLLILLIAFMIFGAGKLPRVMGDLGKGMRALRDGLKDGEADSAKTPSQIPQDKDRV
jgi:sec-independent protein translocase protein TatA